MTYDDAIETEFTTQEAIREIKKHSLDAYDFINEIGQKSVYTGQEILDWLGY